MSPFALNVRMARGMIAVDVMNRLASSISTRGRPDRRVDGQAAPRPSDLPSTSSSLIVRGAPGRFANQAVEASFQEAVPPLHHRGLVQPTLSTTATFESPPAASNTIRARCAIECGDFGRTR
jgi:hypothetical protein